MAGRCNFCHLSYPPLRSEAYKEEAKAAIVS
jgi:hypothetical protein